MKNLWPGNFRRLCFNLWVSFRIQSFDKYSQALTALKTVAEEKTASMGNSKTALASLILQNYQDIVRTLTWSSTNGEKSSITGCSNLEIDSDIFMPCMQALFKLTALEWLVRLRRADSFQQIVQLHSAVELMSFGDDCRRFSQNEIELFASIKFCLKTAFNCFAALLNNSNQQNLSISELRSVNASLSSCLRHVQRQSEQSSCYVTLISAVSTSVAQTTLMLMYKDVAVASRSGGTVRAFSHLGVDCQREVCRCYQLMATFLDTQITPVTRRMDEVDDPEER